MTTPRGLVLAAVFLAAACGGGGGSGPVPPNNGGSGTSPPPPPPTSSAAVPTSFTEQAILRGIVHDFGYSNDMNPMVRLFAGGGAAGDIDSDGDIDLFILRGNLGPNLLYLNQGGAAFTESAAIANLDYTKDTITNYRQSGPVFGDVDGDGDLDLFLGGLENDPSQIYLNDGSGVFTDATTGSGLDLQTSAYTVSAAMGDYDRDGDLDIAMAHWGTPRSQVAPGETETLWRNDSDASGLKFIPLSIGAGISNELALDIDGVLGVDHDYTFSPSFVDINNDGYPDLLSVSDFRGSRVFLNNQNGTFTNITDTFVITDENGMGSAVGDYDNDGDMDWFVSSIQGNRLYENTGTNFARAANAADVEMGGWGWGSCFADFNADGRLDIYQTNGWDIGGDPASSPYVEDTSRLWMANDDGTFSDLASVSGMADTEQGRGIICDDFDGDGDVDVLLLTADSLQAALLWTNDLQNANSISIQLRGLAPNTMAIGARISVTTGSTTQTRMVGINSNFTSHNSTEQIIGLADNTVIDAIEVIWPDGKTSSMTNVAANQRLVLQQPT